MAKVLHIDAEPLIRIITSKHLIGLGYEFLEPPDGGEGLALFRLHRPDIVLSGPRMPERDGFRVVEQMAPASPETPVLMLSGTGDITDVGRCMLLGAWDFLSKPPASPASLQGCGAMAARSGWCFSNPMELACRLCKP